MKQTFVFQSPYFLFLLLLIPFFIFWIKKTILPSIGFSSLQIMPKESKSFKAKILFFIPWIKNLAFLFLVLALARPSLNNKTNEIISEGIDMMMAIDSSGSMKAIDFKLNGKEVNRLEVIKNVVNDFLDKRISDRIGLVIFGDEAYTQCPLTTDKNTLKSFLGWVRIGIVGEETAVGDAIAVSLKRLKDQTTKSKIIILLTDGRSNAGSLSPESATELAKNLGIRIYTIGVGSNGPVPYIEQTPFGPKKIFAKLDLDEALLKSIAEQTGGRYFRASDTNELKEVYSAIDQLEKTEIKTKEYNDYFELYRWFVMFAILFFITEIILTNWVCFSIP